VTSHAVLPVWNASSGAPSAYCYPGKTRVPPDTRVDFSTYYTSIISVIPLKSALAIRLTKR
jgi:hypothetical protein